MRKIGIALILLGVVVLGFGVAGAVQLRARSHCAVALVATDAYTVDTIYITVDGPGATHYCDWLASQDEQGAGYTIQVDRVSAWPIGILMEPTCRAGFAEMTVSIYDPDNSGGGKALCRGLMRNGGQSGFSTSYN